MVRAVNDLKQKFLMRLWHQQKTRTFCNVRKLNLHYYRHAMGVKSSQILPSSCLPDVIQIYHFLAIMRDSSFDGRLVAWVEHPISTGFIPN